MTEIMRYCQLKFPTSFQLFDTLLLPTDNLFLEHLYIFFIASGCTSLNEQNGNF